ncbi:MAG: GNAT family N-acetyltransferase [Nitriliruptoraceae bacterium]|nr:GNAT family N-acetyltransferase [Nitriliruptoraceae bacterium]
MIELRTHDRIPTGTDRGEWELLVEQDPTASVFQTPRYLGAWHRTLGSGTPLRVHTVHRDGRLVGVIVDANDLHGAPSGPEEIRRFAGGTEVTDYLGPVARPEDRSDVAEAYIANLAADVDWDEFVAGGLPRDSGWADVFRRSAADHGLIIFADEVEDVCPRIALTGDHDDYLASLPGRLRQELTRKTRKLARDGGGIELIEVPPGEVAGRLDAFLDQAAESFPEKAGFFRRDDMHAWFAALAEEFAADRVLRLHELHVGGLPAASTVSLVSEGEWGLYNSAFDPVMASLAPGFVIVGQLIEAACAEGVRVFDLLRGDEAYKYRFGATDRPLDRLTIVRS